MKTNPRARRPGFTLIEIMVATAISIVLVIGVVKIAGDSITAYNNAMSMVATTATSRQILDTLETDIQAAVIRTDGNVWMECLTDSNPDPTQQGNFDPGACQSLVFFGTPGDRDRFKPGAIGAARVEYAGDICAMRYRVMNDTPLPAGLSTTDRAYCLTRLVVNPEDTFKSVLENTTKTPGSDALTPSRALSSLARPLGGGSYAQNLPSDIFGMNVVGITPVFVFKKTDATKTPSSWYFYAAPDSPVNRNFYATNFKEGFGSEDLPSPCKPVFFKTLQISGGKYAYSSSSTSQTARPADADWKEGSLTAILFSLTVVDDIGADKIRSAQGRSGPKIPDDEWQKIITEHGRTYVRRVNIPGAN